MELHIKEIAYLEPALMAAKLPMHKPWVFLDGANHVGGNAKFSFIAYDPVSIITCIKDELYVDGVKSLKSPVVTLKALLQQYSFHTTNVLPFQGGLAGYIGYEFVDIVENKIQLLNTSPRIPNLVLGVFDLVVAFDNHNLRCWIYSSGIPETNEALRRIRARDRSDFMLALINQKVHSTLREQPVLDKSEIKSNVSFGQYCSAIDEVQRYIQAGDIYQANISQQYRCILPPHLSAFELYQRLRTLSPAPFSAFINFKEITIASASPERFISSQNNIVITSPIKGTSKRGSILHEDQKLAHALSHCEKNRAENLMIVDLMRNDFAKVCELFSIKVPTLFGIETYSTVHHLVSTISGKLKKECDLIDLLMATFPGGSITGAPKLRAIEIIDEIETHARGPYCGTIGYFGFDGTMDTSIVIRTFVIEDRWVTFNVGGGIVADSNAQDEYLETLIKANAMYAALTGASLCFER